VSDDVFQDRGFADHAEFSRMVASVQLTTVGWYEAFRRWQFDDGTRKGLQALLDRQAKAAGGSR
jgi:hypothetical protein